MASYPEMEWLRSCLIQLLTVATATFQLDYLMVIRWLRHSQASYWDSTESSRRRRAVSYHEAFFKNKETFSESPPQKHALEFH